MYKQEESSGLRFDRKFWLDLSTLLKEYFSSNFLYSIFLLLLITLCVVGTVRALVLLNDFNKDFFNALQTFDTKLIMSLSWRLILIILLLILSSGHNSYFMGLLVIRWRQLATETFIGRWLKNNNYYNLKLLNNKTDNIDQRIANDLDEFPASTLQIYSLLLNSVLTIFSFGYTLWSASIPFYLGASNIKIPGFFCLCAILYASFGTFLTNVIGKKLSFLNYNQQKFNANFRFGLIRLQESSLEIASYRGEVVEKGGLLKVFHLIINNALTINQVKKRLAFFSIGYTNFGLILGCVIAAPFFLQKKMDMGTLMLVSGAFTYTVNAFSIFINIFDVLAGWRATLSRIVEMKKILETKPNLPLKIELKEHAKNTIEIINLTLRTPQEKILHQNINLVFHIGSSYLIKGQSGTGKSTLYKAMAGLWHNGSGEIYLPSQRKIFFTPQKPYLIPGTLTENLLYPKIESLNNSYIENILELIELKKYKNLLSCNLDWSKALSLGEQQLISFARALINKPDIIFLDEATSSLDEKLEAHLYNLLKNILPNLTLISIGHRSTLDKFHQNIIILNGVGYSEKFDLNENIEKENMSMI